MMEYMMEMRPNNKDNTYYIMHKQTRNADMHDV